MHIEYILIFLILKKYDWVFKKKVWALLKVDPEPHAPFELVFVILIV